ncbi:MAG: hypothetical protein H0U21_12985, partial [Acidimicrobiia bacterium]|nr:hypothetical protein [Acidimicrobiia bacterium]
AGTASPPDLLLATGTCLRLDGALGDLGDSTVQFVVDDLTGRGEVQYLTATGDQAWSSSDFVEFERSSWTAGPGRFSLVVGDRSAVLIVDGLVRAGVRTFGPVAVAVSATGGVVALRDMSSAPSGTTGC